MRKLPEDLLHRVVEALREIGHQSSHPEVARHHPGPTHHLVQIEDLLSLPEAVQKDALGPDFERHGPQGHEMALDPRQFREENPDDLGPCGDLDSQELFHTQHKGQVVRHGGQVIEAVRDREGLLIPLRLHDLLHAGMEIADVRGDFDDHLPIKLKHEPQHSMGRGVLRAHVDRHGLRLGHSETLTRPNGYGLQSAGHWCSLDVLMS